MLLWSGNSDGPRFTLKTTQHTSRSCARRMSKDYERLCETSQAMIYAVMSRLMLGRLARA
jgi:hypothetical protein